MSKQTSITSTFLGLLLVAGVAAAGSFGLWDGFALPPVVFGAIAAVGLQWIAFMFAWRFQSERFFDLTGSATFVMVVLLSMFLSRAHLGPLDVLLATAVIVWAVRLGCFLTARIHLAGSDQRFEAIKRNFFWFLMTWTLQGTWVVVTAGAVMTVIGDGVAQPIGLIEIGGLLTWLFGISIEAIADEQKRKFRLAGSSSFISSGLWSRSRHPNYFGEIVLWSGLAIAVLPSLNGWQLITMISPAFVWILLMRISGVPMLEAKSDLRWADDPSYDEYKKTTPLLILRLW